MFNRLLMRGFYLDGRNHILQPHLTGGWKEIRTKRFLVDGKAAAEFDASNTISYLSFMKRDDLLWKALLEDVFDDFLLFFFKEQATIINFERGFEFLDKELDQLFPVPEAEATHPRFVDKLVKMFTKDGREEWMLVHVEIQGYNDPEFSKRMFTYFYRILDKYNKRVTSIAIFTDSNRKYMPHAYNYSFMGAEVTFTYNVYKIIDQDAANLSDSDNPFAFVVLTALIALQKGRQLEEEIVPLKINIARALFKKAIPAKKISAIMNFLRYYVHFDKIENNSKFEEALSIITSKNKTTMGIEEFLLQRAEKKGKLEGMEEGIEKGVEKGKIEFVKSLLQNTDFNNEKIASLVSVTVDFVLQVKKQAE